MKIILEERIPNPKVPYAYKNIIVEGKEGEDLAGEIELQKKKWKESLKITPPKPMSSQMDSILSEDMGKK